MLCEAHYLAIVECNERSAWHGRRMFWRMIAGGTLVIFMLVLPLLMIPSGVQPSAEFMLFMGMLIIAVEFSRDCHKRKMQWAQRECREILDEVKNCQGCLRSAFMDTAITALEDYMIEEEANEIWLE